MNIFLFQKNVKEKIEHQLLKLASQSNDSPLFSSTRYSLLAPGKRLRPLLLFAVCESFNTHQEIALIPACALEMIHTYSLIHDDLPCMDDDDFRRDQPSLHKAYPEWQALLTGDFLLTYAFEILSGAPDLDADQKLDLISSLAKRAGSEGMIGGQMIDLLSEGQKIDWEILEQMHLGKTSGLIIAALEFGGIIAQASSKDLDALRKAGAAIGIAFQLIDDILDHTHTDRLARKLPEREKTTAVALLGMEKAKEKAESFLRDAQEHLKSLSVETPLLHQAFNQMVHRSK
jgi:geranylgeranyl diphosphate synthase type II